MKVSRNFVESLSRGLSVLSVLCENSSPLTLTELSNRLKLSISAVQRLTFTLQQLGYLERDEETKKYRFGQKLLSLGLSVMRNLDTRKVASPFLQKTSWEIGENVNLGVLEGTEIVYLERIKTQQILDINLSVGSRLPIYCTSMGKAMLAFLSSDRIDEILDRVEFKPLTPYTITNKEDFLTELKEVRARGYAVSNEELTIGLRSVAAPVRNFTGEVIASVNTGVFSIRVPLVKLETVLAKKIMETAEKISFALGHRSVPE
jgi:IclR family pca regulon transcriptional regulator